MRFLHTGDLHLGKQLNDVSLLDDQQHILAQIADIAAEKQVDALLIAGDVYQRSAPQAEAMALFDKFVSRLVSLGLKLFIISGNHDSSLRISYFSDIVRTAGVYVSQRFDGRLQQIMLSDEHGPVVVHLMPFIKPLHVRRALPEAEANTYQEAVRTVVANSPVDTSVRNILICHQFITGSETSDSEESSVGGLDNIDASVFCDFDYVALGHIHKPQRMTRDTLRYSGSPLKYSFSEVNHRKSVCIVDVNEKGSVCIETVPLVPKRDMRLVTGTAREIMSMDPSDDYVWVTVTDELVPPDIRLEIAANVFPNMLKFSVSNSRTRYDADITAAEAIESKQIDELFRDFYRMQNSNAEPGDAHMKVLRDILNNMEDESHEAD